MNDNDIVIVSVGMCASVGLNAKKVSANIRAGTAHFGENAFCGFVGNPVIVSVLPHDALPALPETMIERPYFTRREGLLLRLGLLALKDCVSNYANKKISTPSLWLSLPEHETAKPINPSQWMEDFLTLNPKVFDSNKSCAKWRGRSGGLQALQGAIQSLQKNETAFALVGGVDTFHDPFVLINLQFPGGNRVKAKIAKDYFIPGEGAGFILITTHAQAKAKGLNPLAKVASPADGFEDGYWGSKNSYLGEGLATTISTLFEKEKSTELVQEIICTMNGESYWTKEWGIAQIRNASAISPKAKIQHPADCFGDIGAAFGPVLLGLAALGIKEGYRKAPALIYTSSDFGQRAATLVTELA
jgi:3-oxoacyl-[acyl-carrier-protein] synthase-1